MNQIASLPSKFYPLQWKLLVPLLIIGGVSVFSLNMLFNHILLEKLKQLELRRAHQLVNTISHVAETVETSEQLHRFISALGAEQDIKLIVIIANHPAKVIASTRYVWLGKLLIELPQELLGEELYQALQNQQSNYSYHPEIYEFNFSAPLLLSEGTQLKNDFYHSVVTIHFNTIPIQTILYPANWLIRAWTLGLLTLIFIFVYIWINHLVRRPLQVLYESIQKRMAGDKTITMPILAHDEIGITAHLFNTLLEQQEQDQAEIKKLALVAQHTDNSVVITDAKLRIEWVNDAFTRLSGYTLDEVIGKRPGAFLHGPETNPTTLANIRTALRNQQLAQAELINYTKSGQFYWIAFSIQPIYDEQGTLTHFFSVERDITEQKRSEQKLQQQAQIIHQTHDAVITMDTHYFITYWNQGAEKLYGYTAQEAMGQPLSLLYFPEDRDKLQRASMEALLKTENYDVEVHLLKKSGEVFFAHCSFSLLRDSEEKVSGLIGFTIDITERQHLETVLKAERAILTRRVEERVADLSAANAQLKKANQLKDEFLANMSHELRTPLNAILGMSEILTEQVYGELNEKQLRSVQNIHTGGNHLLCLINDILDLAKIEAGKVELQLESFNIAEICQASLAFIKQSAHKKRLHVSLQIDPNLDTLTADQRRVKQILVNLLNNAVKFTPENGSISLEVTPHTQEQCVVFSVIDTGIGIEQTNLTRLFNPFERVDKDLNVQQEEGTGLGLALVQQLAELHGGSVMVESQIGQGSHFTVVLPDVEQTKTSVVEEAVETKEPLDNTPTSAEIAPLILLAEDNPNNVEVIVDYLSAFGYRLKVASTGIEVLTSLTEERPALILMDIQMPGMDGLEATQRIRANMEYQNLPIIALTALTMSGDRERCLEAGMNDYLSKPVNLRHLLQLVKQFSNQE